MATIRRLSDTDVRTIFESVHHNRHPPSHLHFQVVPVGTDGLRLSPPSYEFEDGLYILMKPQKKKAQPSEQPKVPTHLTDYVLRDTPPSSCPWSLSGPQFPQPTAIQQRYCYPKGDPEYSSRKGGALWTMYGEDGKENLEYRLLHVYFSAKRAVNKGMKVKTPQSTPNKRAKRTPPRVPKPVEYLTPPPPPPKPLSYLSPEPARECSSPLSFEVTPPSPTISPMAAYKSSNFVSPHVFDDGSFYSPFRPRVLHPSNGEHDVIHEPLQFDHFAALDDMHTSASMQELEDACWNDPLFPPPADGGESLESLKNGLEKMHATIREKIAASPESEQGPLVSLFSSWARQVANDPLHDDDSNFAQV